MGEVINNLEFYTIDGEVWYLTSDGRNERLDETQTDVITRVLDVMMESYPAAYKALSEEYQKSALNVWYYRYLICKRFCKCNFGKLDTSEMDFGTSLNFEKVDCPLRGECKLEGIVCMPKFNTSLSKKELQVMKLVYEGLSKEEIAEKLYLSPFTIKNHVKSVYAKLGIHDKSEFIQYANRNNVFK